jgi:hypothetical protein
LQNNNHNYLEGGLQYIVFKPLGICLEDLQGNPLMVRGCSLDDAKQLSAIMDILWREANSFSLQQPDITPHEVYHKSSLFKHLSQYAISLCGISSSQVDLNMLICLLFPFEFSYKQANESGEVQVKRELVDGILMQLNFPRSTSPTLKHLPSKPGKKSKQANWNDMFASVWLSSKNLDHTIQATRILPWNELSEAMLSRNETISEALATPEEREAKEVKQAFQELMQSDEKLAREFGQFNNNTPIKLLDFDDQSASQDNNEIIKQGLQKEIAVDAQNKATQAALGLPSGDFFSLVDDEDFGLTDDGELGQGFREIQPGDI